MILGKSSEKVKMSKKKNKESEQGNNRTWGKDGNSINPKATKESVGSDVTKEDLQVLGDDNLSMDMGEDEQLRNRVWPVDFAGEDLDIPGSEQDDRREEIGSEDEENNSYSLGGENHEDLEEDKS